MWNASSTESPVQGSVVPGLSSRADLRPQLTPAPTLVAITSVVTETVHPTLFVTEVTTVGMSRLETTLFNVGQSQGEKSSGQPMQPGTVQTNASQTQAVQLGISTAATQLTEISPASSAVSTSTTSAQESTTVSVATEISSTSSATAKTVLGTTTTPTSTQTGVSTLVTSLAQAISTSLSSQSPSPSPSLSPSLTPLPTPSPSPESSAGAAITSGSDFTNGQLSQSTSRAHLGAIVGGTLGGTVFLALALLAFMLCLRARRRRPVKPRSPGRGLLRNSGDSLAALCNRLDQPEIQSSHPMRPIPSPRGNTTRPAPAPKSAVAVPSQGLVLNTMGLFRDSYQNPSCDPEGSPVSPIINVHPPSRTVSMYSQPSWEGDTKVLEKSDLEFPTSRDPRYERVYLSNESNTPALPSDDTLAPWDNGKIRLSTRSDPFDLEVPPTALHECPPLPRPTSWGNRF